MFAQWSAYSGRSSSRSTSRARLSADVIGEEGAGLVGRRQPADHVEVGSPQERGIACGFRGSEAELLELGPDVVVDEVVPRQRGVELVGHLAGQGDDDVAVGELPFETGP